MKFLFLSLLSFTLSLHAEQMVEVEYIGSAEAEAPSIPVKPAPPALEAKSKAILELSKHLDSASGRSAFLKAFPQDKASFSDLCISEFTLPTSDCHEIILNGLGETAKHPDSVKETAKRLSGLASELGFDADAPNYVQETLSKVCLQAPKEFAEAIATLNSKAQSKAMRFLNENFSDKNREDYIACLAKLKSAQEKKLADLGAKALRKKK